MVEDKDKEAMMILDEEKSKDINAIHQCMDGAMTAFLAQNMYGVMQYYTKTCVVLYPGTTFRHGRDCAAQEGRNFIDPDTGLDLSCHQIQEEVDEIMFLRKDLAVCITEAHVWDKNHDTLVTSQKGLGVYKKSGDKWLLHIGIAS